MRKTPLIFLAISIFGLLLSLVVIELLLRIPLHTTITWKEDPILGNVLLSPQQEGWFVTPSKEYKSYITSNKEGFYDDNHTVQKPENTYRIILLGDSFVASLQTAKDRTIGKRLEEKLNSLGLPYRIEVISIGMGDTGSAQQLLALQSIGLKYQPDLVIQMFLTANDLKNNWPALQQDPYRPYFTLDQSNNLIELPHARRSDRPMNGIKEELKKLRIINIILAARQNWQERQANESADYPIDYHVYDLNYSNDYQSAWQVTQNILLKTRSLVEDQQKAKYMLVTLANNEQVSAEVWNSLKESYPNLKTASLDLQKPEKLMTEFCTAQKIQCHFMLEDFLTYQKSNPNSKTHYAYDGHWTDVGTEVAVQSLTNFLTAEKENYFSIK